MSDLWKKIQPLRVANGWTIDLNNLYDIELTQENIGNKINSITKPKK